MNSPTEHPVEIGDETNLAAPPPSTGTAIRQRNAACVAILLAAGLYLLDVLGAVLRPLFIAMLFCYAIMPLHIRLRRYVSPSISLLIIGGCVMIGIYAIGRMVYTNVVDIYGDLPRLQQRADMIKDQTERLADRVFPWLAAGPDEDDPEVDDFEPMDPGPIPDGAEAIDGPPPDAGQTSFISGESPDPAGAKVDIPAPISTGPDRDDLEASGEPRPIPSPARPPSTAEPGPTPEGTRLPPEPAIVPGLEGLAPTPEEPTPTSPPSGELAPEIPVPIPEPGLDPEAPASNQGEAGPPSLLKTARDLLRQAVGLFADFILEATVVGLYVVFLLAEATVFPRKVHAAFPAERADGILRAVDSINRGVFDYLTVKVKVNLLVAVPATLVMALFGVEGPAMWGVLTFFGRFIPYLGSIATCALPIALALLQFDALWWPIAFGVVLVGVHVVIEYAIEPVITGRALGLSPLVVLIALAFWSVVWGIVGMCLAVPLTVILKITLDHIAATRPFARMLAHE